MPNPADDNKLTRRGFLVAVPLTGVSASLAQAEGGQADTPPSTDTRKVVLADTPHIRKFYELARS